MLFGKWRERSRQKKKTAKGSEKQNFWHEKKNAENQPPRLWLRYGRGKKGRGGKQKRRPGFWKKQTHGRMGVKRNSGKKKNLGAGNVIKSMQIEQGSQPEKKTDQKPRSTREKKRT